MDGVTSRLMPVRSRLRAISFGPTPGVLGKRILVRERQRLVRRNAVVIAAGDLVAFLICKELLDRVGLLNVRGHPVANPFPRRIRVGAEHQLADAGRHFQQLRAGCMRTERRMDDDARQDLASRRRRSRPGPSAPCRRPARPSAVQSRKPVSGSSRQGYCSRR